MIIWNAGIGRYGGIDIRHTPSIGTGLYIPSIELPGRIENLGYVMVAGGGSTKNGPAGDLVFGAIMKDRSVAHSMPGSALTLSIVPPIKYAAAEFGMTKTIVTTIKNTQIITFFIFGKYTINIHKMADFCYNRLIIFFDSVIKRIISGVPATVITTSIWSVVFVVSILVLNFVHSSRSSAAFYSDETLGIGSDGTLPIEDGTSFASGLPVRYSFGTAEQSWFGMESNSAVALSNSPTGIVLERDGLKRYKVRKGDSITSIAAQFGISKETIQWANGNIRSVRVGDELVILPINGILYEVKSGDTIESIANNYQISAGIIKQYNKDYQKILSASKGTLMLGGAKPGIKNIATSEKLPAAPKGFFALPLVGNNFGELHLQNAVDIEGKCGASVTASAAGTVVEDEELHSDGASGWNNGYGSFVLLQHSGGIKTRYAHLEKVAVKVGDEVQRGDVVGFTGNTGSAEGPAGCRLHFEVLGAQNPFATH